jgi:hypothetical protein
MTDMRATERLLEVIQESADILDESGLGELGCQQYAERILEAITELRRRGDTLVRREDLRIAVESIELDELSWVYMDAEKFAPVQEAIARLENAIGGKLA